MRVFVTAPATVDTSPILQVLQQLGVEAVALTELAAGSSFAHIDPPDALVAVLATGAAGKAGSEAVQLEIGIALGRGVPVFLVIEPPLHTPPALQGLPQVLTRSDDQENLGLHLRSFLRGAGRERAPGRRAVASAVATATTKRRLDEIRKLASQSPARAGMEFEQLAADLFAEGGAVVVPAANLRGEGLDARADLALMVPGEEERLGLLLVEVKATQQSGTQAHHVLSRAKRQLQEYVLQSRAGLGLLVFDAPNLKDWTPTSTPLVLDVSIDSLIEELSKRPLAAILISARNRAVHAL